MTWLLLQVQLWSWRNRLRTRLRRLRQPRYLISFIVGVAYIGLIWQPWNRGRWIRVGESPFHADPSLAPAAEIGVAALLTLFAVGAWLWPRRRPALEFSETEIAFLLPAPLQRRQVVNYSLIRGQFGLLFGSLMVSFFGVRQIAPSFLQAFLGTWIVFSTLQMYYLGAAILRSSLLRHGGSGLRRVAPFVLPVVAIFTAVALWWHYWLRPPTLEEQAGGAGIASYVVAMGEAGPMRFLLWPARALVRPAFVSGVVPLAVSLVPALALLLASYVWVIRSDFAYEEASAERATRRAARRADHRGRRRRYERIKEASRRPPFPLAASGRPEIALLWKNLIASGRFLTLRRAAAIAVGSGVVAGWLRRSVAGSAFEDPLRSVGAVAFMFCGMLFLMGPLMTRSDLRTDLLQASILKTWPLPGWSLLLGEALAPTLLIAYWQLVLATVGLALIPPAFAPGLLDRALLLGAVAILALPLNALSVLVQSATVLLFPSWLTLGPERARGLEAFGQRFLASLVRLLALAVVFLPAGGILGLGLLLGYRTFGNPVIPLSAAVAILPAIGEAAVALFLLGLRFDSFDPTHELDVST